MGIRNFFNFGGKDKVPQSKKVDVPASTKENRHGRRSQIAIERGAKMRVRKKAIEDERDKQRKATAARVKRQQGAAHARAVVRKETAKKLKASNQIL